MLNEINKNLKSLIFLPEIKINYGDKIVYEFTKIYL